MCGTCSHPSHLNHRLESGDRALSDDSRMVQRGAVVAQAAKHGLTAVCTERSNLIGDRQQRIHCLGPSDH